jgi:hypothetical protein
MPYLNQFLYNPNARVNAGAKIYTTTVVSDKGTAATATDTITFTDLQLNIDGQDFKATKALAFSSLGALVQEGKEYLVAAVASYDEPTDQTAAEAAGLDYYVVQNPKGEAVAYRFFPSDVTALLEASGGIDVIKQRMFDGSATSTEISAYNQYYETIQKMNDPKFAAKPLLPTGYELVVGELVYQDNSSRENVLTSYTKPQFLSLKARLGEIYTFRKVLTGAQATTAYATRLWAIKTATSYATLIDAQTDVNGTDVTEDIKLADSTNVAYTFAAAYYVVHEYIVASTTDVGQTFKGHTVVRWLDKQVSTTLGRMNPIYLDNQSLTGTVRLPQQAMSRLNQFPYACSLAKVTLGAASAITSTTYVYDTGF